MKTILIITTSIVLAIAALAIAQGNQGQGNGQHQGQGNGQHQGQGNGQHQGQGNGQHQGQGNGQHQGQGNGNGQHQGQGNGSGSSCTMNSETSLALYEALVGSDGEYAAYAMYGAVIDKYGAVEPYLSIQKAEGKHIDSLKRQMDKYGISYPPVNPYLGNVEAPDSLEEAAAAWAEGEIANIAMYDDLLLASKDCDSVTRVFNNLRRASADMHLPAFELAAQSGGTLSPAQMEDLKAEHHNGNGGEGCQEEGQGNANGENQHQGGLGIGQKGQTNSGPGQNQVEEIMSKFQELDLDANGEISKQEFFNVKTANMTQKAQEGKEMKNAANAPAFEDMDSNGDESISMEEFGMFAMNHHAQENANNGQVTVETQVQNQDLEMPVPVKLATNADNNVVRAALLETHETLCEDVGNAAQILMKTETLAKALPFIMDMTGMQPGEIEALEQSTCNADLSNASVPEIRVSNQNAAWLVDIHLAGIDLALTEDASVEKLSKPLPLALASKPDKEVIHSTILAINNTLCEDIGHAAQILMKTETLAKALPFIMDMTGMQPGEIEALEQSTCKTDLSNASITEIRESNRVAVWLVDLHLVGINKALSAE